MAGTTSALRRRLLFAAVTLALLLLVQEGIVRLVFPVPEVLNFSRLNYAHGGAQRGKASAQALANSWLWWWSEPDGAQVTRRMNLYEFRGPTWARKASSPRVGFFGDSFVEGLGAPDAETIPVVFAARAEEAGADLEVLNLGAAGFGLRDYRALLRDAAQLFGLDSAILVLYMNDLYNLPPVTPIESLEPILANPFEPRLLNVLSRYREGLRVPLRWPEPAESEPRPINVAPRLEADPLLARNIERFVEPEIAEAMRGGRLNPAITNLLARSERALAAEVDIAPQLAAFAASLRETETDLYVVYLPSLNQVSDAYLPAQRRLSAPIKAVSLTGEEFQHQARDVARACGDLGLPFLDLTPALRSAEDAGVRLFWPYDAHMNGDGYTVVGEAIFGWWSEPGTRHKPSPGP